MVAFGKARKLGITEAPLQSGEDAAGVNDTLEMSRMRHGACYSLRRRQNLRTVVFGCLWEDLGALGNLHTYYSQGWQ